VGGWLIVGAILVVGGDGGGGTLTVESFFLEHIFLLDRGGWSRSSI